MRLVFSKYVVLPNFCCGGILRPLQDLLLITSCQATLKMPRGFEVPLQRNEWIIEKMTLVIPFGIAKPGTQYKENELKTDLIRHILQAILRNFTFQVLSFALIMDNTSFQVESLLGLAPRGPRYLTRKYRYDIKPRLSIPFR